MVRGGAQTTKTTTTRDPSQTTKKKKKKHTSSKQNIQEQSSSSPSIVVADDTAAEPNSDSSSSSLISIPKIRQIIRHWLQFLKPRSAILYNLVTLLVNGLETILGIQLLQEEEKPAKKSKHKKKKKQHSSTTSSAASSISGQKSKKTSASSSSKTKTTTTMEHVTKSIATHSPNYRIQRELKKFLQDPPEHLKVKVGKNIRIWIVEMQGVGIYENEMFHLRIQFPANYPTRPPSVYFLPPHIPIHEHVYTNGDICLSLLGKDWRPTMTAESIAISILSILASATSKTLPMDNARHAGNKPGEYQENWVYHDDSC